MEKYTAILAYLLLIFILYLDFFKEGVSLFLPLMILVALVIVSTVLARNEKFAWKISKSKFAFLSIVEATILMLLTIAFYWMGGRSQHGINPTGYAVWIVYVISLFQAFKEMKKARKSAQMH